MERIRFAAQTDVPALLSIYQQYIDTSITFEYTLPTPEEFARRVEAIYLAQIARRSGREEVSA